MAYLNPPLRLHYRSPTADGMAYLNPPLWLHYQFPYSRRYGVSQSTTPVTLSVPLQQTVWLISIHQSGYIISSPTADGMAYLNPPLRLHYQFPYSRRYSVSQSTTLITLSVPLQQTVWLISIHYYGYIISSPTADGMAYLNPPLRLHYQFPYSRWYGVSQSTTPVTLSVPLQQTVWLISIHQSGYIISSPTADGMAYLNPPLRLHYQFPYSRRYGLSQSTTPVTLSVPLQQTVWLISIHHSGYIISSPTADGMAYLNPPIRLHYQFPYSRRYGLSQSTTPVTLSVPLQEMVWRISIHHSGYIISSPTADGMAYLNPPLRLHYQFPYSRRYGLSQSTTPVTLSVPLQQTVWLIPIHHSGYYISSPAADGMAYLNPPIRLHYQYPYSRRYGLSQSTTPVTLSVSLQQTVWLISIHHSGYIISIPTADGMAYLNPPLRLHYQYPYSRRYGLSQSTTPVTLSVSLQQTVWLISIHHSGYIISIPTADGMAYLNPPLWLHYQYPYSRRYGLSQSTTLVTLSVSLQQTVWLISIHHSGYIISIPTADGMAYLNPPLRLHYQFPYSRWYGLSQSTSTVGLISIQHSGMAYLNPPLRYGLSQSTTPVTLSVPLQQTVWLISIHHSGMAYLNPPLWLLYQFPYSRRYGVSQSTTTVTLSVSLQQTVWLISIHQSGYIISSPTADGMAYLNPPLWLHYQFPYSRWYGVSQSTTLVTLSVPLQQTVWLISIHHSGYIISSPTADGMAYLNPPLWLHYQFPYSRRYGLSQSTTLVTLSVPLQQTVWLISIHHSGYIISSPTADGMAYLNPPLWLHYQFPYSRRYGVSQSTTPVTLSVPLQQTVWLISIHHSGYIISSPTADGMAYLNPPLRLHYQFPYSRRYGLSQSTTLVTLSVPLQQTVWHISIHHSVYIISSPTADGMAYLNPPLRLHYQFPYSRRYGLSQSTTPVTLSVPLQQTVWLISIHQSGYIISSPTADGMAYLNPPLRLHYQFPYSRWYGVSQSTTPVTLSVPLQQTVWLISIHQSGYIISSPTADGMAYLNPPLRLHYQFPYSRRYGLSQSTTPVTLSVPLQQTVWLISIHHSGYIISSPTADGMAYLNPPIRLHYQFPYSRRYGLSQSTTPVTLSVPLQEMVWRISIHHSGYIISSPTADGMAYLNPPLRLHYQFPYSRRYGLSQSTTPVTLSVPLQQTVWLIPIHHSGYYISSPAADGMAYLNPPIRLHYQYPYSRRYGLSQSTTPVTLSVSLQQTVWLISIHHSGYIISIPTADGMAYLNPPLRLHYQYPYSRRYGLSQSTTPVTLSVSLQQTVWLISIHHSGYIISIPTADGMAYLNPPLWLHYQYPYSRRYGLSQSTTLVTLSVSLQQTVWLISIHHSGYIISIPTADGMAYLNPPLRLHYQFPYSRWYGLSQSTSTVGLISIQHSGMAYLNPPLRYGLSQSTTPVTLSVPLQQTVWLISIHHSGMAYLNPPLWLLYQFPYSRRYGVSQSTTTVTLSVSLQQTVWLISIHQSGYIISSPTADGMAYLNPPLWLHYQFPYSRWYGVSQSTTLVTLSVPLQQTVWLISIHHSGYIISSPTADGMAYLNPPLWLHYQFPYSRRYGLSQSTTPVTLSVPLQQTVWLISIHHSGYIISSPTADGMAYLNPPLRLHYQFPYSRRYGLSQSTTLVTLSVPLQQTVWLISIHHSGYIISSPTADGMAYLNPPLWLHYQFPYSRRYGISQSTTPFTLSVPLQQTVWLISIHHSGYIISSPTADGMAYLNPPLWLHYQFP